MNANQSEPKLTERAGFWERAVAYLIDGLILSFVTSAIVPVISFGFLLPFYWWADSFSNEPDIVPFWFIGTGVLLWILIWGAYFVGFWVRRGQTPGKMAMRISVIQTNGSAITVEKALLRYLGYIVCGAFVLIPFLWVVFDPRKQGIHDKFAGTCVVKIGKS
ncbi:MAG: RDD family protein [Chloroflexi bacterium]|nr:RDD family protein [Chloroflexota bacterium]